MDWEDYNFGGAFRQNLRRRIRQSLATNRLRQTKRSPTLVEQLPSREPPKYNYLYTKENRANALNLVALVSSEITSNQDISILAEIPIENPEFVGRGATTEVLAVDWKAGDDYPTTRVAIKRVSRDYAPARDKNCPLEHDNLYLTQRDAFYAKVEDMMQEIRIMAREPFCSHRNIVRLLGVSWDCVDGSLFAPLMVVELAWPKAPTLQHYFSSPALGEPERGTIRDLICDIADGLSALHFCDVLHSDLKPANVLLFQEVRGATKKLTAKIGDFGFADVDRVLGDMDGVVRGGTRQWAAPELLRGCPGSIRGLARTVPTAADVYSFGLIVAYMALDGVDPLDLGGWTPGRLDELKFDDRLGVQVEGAISARWMDAGKDLEDLQLYISLFRDTLKRDPTIRLSSLATVRKRVFGEQVFLSFAHGCSKCPIVLLTVGRDPYARQKVTDRFRVRHLTNSCELSLSFGSYFRVTTHMLSTRVLNNLSANLLAELKEIVGDKVDVFEPTMHTIYRTQLRPSEDKPRDPNWAKRGLSLEMIQGCFVTARDFYELANFIQSQVNVFPSAEYDLHVTEWHERPAIFTLIDGNNVQATKELLSRDPEQKLRKLSGNSEGWYPLHLAACLGQTRIMELLLSEPYNVDPNARSDMSRLTPLHQAVISQKPDAVELLLASGARVDAKYYIPYAKMLRDLTALEIALECCASDRCATLEDRRIVAILLHHGADYLRNSSGRGYSIAFKAIGYPDMLKVFFDTLPPEDGKRLVTVVDNEGQTMLMRAAFCHRAPTVRYLLAKGADPSATDCYGQTIYAKLRVSRILPDAATEAISLLARLLGGGDGDMDDILAIFESTGVPGATDMDDYIHTAEELRDMEAIFGEKSDPNAELRKLAEQYSDPLLWLRFSTLMMESLDRCMSRTYTTNPFVWVSALRQSLGRWAESRNRGSIPLDLLPDGWAEIFAEVNKVSPGFWKDFILEEEEIPQITDVASRVAIWVLEKFLECNGLQILDKLADVLNELESSGSLKLITEQCSQVATDVAGISSRHRMTLLAKSSLLYRARKVWRSLSRGEVLDRLHDLAVAAGVDEKVDDIAQDLVAGLLGPWLPPPPTAHETLRLSERYPDTTIFVTAVTEHYISGRLALACVQFVVFLLPALALVVVGWAIYFMIRRGDEFALMILFLWIVLWPKEWVLVDENYHFHPSIWQGISAAAELLIFRLHHVPEPEEPLIVSLGRQPLTHVDVPSRMKVMPHGRMGTVYWLSLRRNGGPKPIPCYGAMRNLMSKWKKGEMPKKAWCEGWWELAANGLWARVDANGSPKWSEYCNASRNIKKILHDEGCEDVYERFLDAREYFLDTPGEQLQKLQKIFGEDHRECLNIWQNLFLRYSPPKASRKKWWNASPVKSFVDLIWYSMD